MGLHLPVLRLVAAAGVLALGIAGCADQGEAVAAEIRAANSPYVVRVDVSPANPVFGGKDWEDVFVYLTGDVTDGQALDLWCSVILPSGGGRLGDVRVQLRKNAVLDANDGRAFGEPVFGSETPACPTGPSSAPSA
jgi:hypothetical protein